MDFTQFLHQGRFPGFPQREQKKQRTFKLYDYLELQKTATEAEISKAAKMLSLKHHPDKVSGDDAKKIADEKIKNINKAKEILMNQEKRQMYDQLGDEGLNEIEQQSSAKQEKEMQQELIMDKRMKDRFKVELEIKLTMKEYYGDIKVSQEFPRRSLCTECHGSGDKNSIRKICPTCNGACVITKLVNMGPFAQQLNSPCNNCKGEGFVNEKKGKLQSCTKCTKGFVTENYTFEHTIPAGIVHPGVKAQISENEGHEYETGHRGIIIATFELNDEKNCMKWNYESNNLTYTLNLQIQEVLFGFEHIIDHPSNRNLKIKSNVTFNPNITKMIPNLGMPKKGSKNGDLIIKFNVNYPKNIDPKLNEKKGTLCELLKKLYLNEPESHSTPPTKTVIHYNYEELDDYNEEHGGIEAHEGGAPHGVQCAQQ